MRVAASAGLVLAMALWLPCAAAMAQDREKPQAKSAHKMDDMVVSATRTEVEADKAPASVTVITREEMEKKNIRTADDAIKNEVGVYAYRPRGVADSTASVTMRGLSNQKRTLILVDGVPFQDGYSNNTMWANIPTDSIERIEIIRGPSSAVYGGNAMGGVVNIILRVPMKTEIMARGATGTGQGNQPSADATVWDYKAGAGGGTRLADTVSVYAGAEGEYNSGYPTSPTVKTTTKGAGKTVGGYPSQSSSGAAAWVVGDSGNNWGSRLAGNTLLAYDFSDTGRLRFDFLFGQQSYDYGTPNSYVGAFSGAAGALPGYVTAAMSPSNFLSGVGSTQSTRYAVSYDDLFAGKLNIKAKAAYIQDLNWYTQPTATTANLGYDNDSGTYSNNMRSSWYFDLQGSYPLWDKNTLTVGGTMRRDEINLYDQNMLYYRNISSTTNTLDRTQGKSNTWSAFAQDQWELWPKLTLYTGLRLDSWTSYDARSGNVGAVQSIENSSSTEWSPRVSLVYQPLDDTTLRASISKGFRAPNLYEMLRAWTSAGTSPVTYLPNPNLKPETLWTYEIGGTQYLWERKVKLGASLYHTDFTNYIDSVDVASGVKQQQNVGRLSVDGLELEGSVSPWEWLTLWGNAALNDSRVQSFSRYPEYVGKRLPTVPAVQANTGVDLKWRRFKADFSGNYAGQTYANYANTDVTTAYGTYTSRWVWDAKLTYSPTKSTDVILSVMNVFDERYYQYYAGSPRMGYLELKVKF